MKDGYHIGLTKRENQSAGVNFYKGERSAYKYSNFEGGRYGVQ